MKKSFPLTFGRDINALNFPVDAREVADLDEDFAEMLALAKTSLSRPALIETSASHFQVLIPASLRHCPMWVVWLGKEFADELTSICHTEPVIWEKTSIDLQRRSSTLEWQSREHTFCARADRLCDSVNNQYPFGSIVIAFMTSNQIALRSLRVDEEFVMDLQLRGTRCDGNYRPGREYHHRELAQAQKQSVLLGNTPRSDENGRKIVMLDSKRFRLSLTSS